MFSVARAIFCTEVRRTFVAIPVKRHLLGNLNGAEKKYQSLVLSGNAYHRANTNIYSLLTWGGLFTFFQKKNEPEPDSELITIIKRGILLWQQGEKRKSEQMFHVALKLAQEQQNHDGVVFILDNLANLAYESNEHDKAHKLFVSVMQHLIVTGVPEDDNRIIHMSLKLAEIYEKTGEKSKAEQGYKFCIEKLENKVKYGADDADTLMLLTMTMVWYAQFAMDLGHYKEAHTYFKKAYELALTLKDSFDEHMVNLLCGLGTSCWYQGDFDNALKYLEESVSLSKKVPEANFKQSIYINLAYVYMQKQMFDEAERACSDARSMAQNERNKTAEYEAEVCLNEIRKYQQKPL